MINARIFARYRKIVALKSFIKRDSSRVKYFEAGATNAEHGLISESFEFNSRNPYSRGPSRVNDITWEVLCGGRSSQRIILLEEKLRYCKYSNRFYSNAEEKNFLAKNSKTGGNEWGSPEAEKLIIKLGDNYLESIKTYDSLLVYFYTLWCRHCKKLKSVYGDAAVKMKEENVAGHLAVINLTERMDIADKFNIVSVPIMYYFKKGKFTKVYDGKRTAEDIVNFMKNPPEKASTSPKIDI